MNYLLYRPSQDQSQQGQPTQAKHTFEDRWGLLGQSFEEASRLLEPDSQPGYEEQLAALVPPQVVKRFPQIGPRDAVLVDVLLADADLEAPGVQAAEAEVDEQALAEAGQVEIQVAEAAAAPASAQSPATAETAAQASAAARQAPPSDSGAGPSQAPPPPAPAPVPGPAPAPAAAPVSSSDPLRVSRGQFLFDIEGNDVEGGAYFSRVLHHPTPGSGVTIGRGYDMKTRTRESVQADLVQAGVDPGTAATLSGGAGLSGEEADAFAKRHASIQITREQQNALFDKVYGDKLAYAAGCVQRWSGLDLHACDQLVIDVVIDLFYRGDLKADKWHAHNMAETFGKNDYAAIRALLADRSLWGNLDTNRYTRRLEYLDQNVAAGTTAAPATAQAAKAPKVPASEARQGEVVEVTASTLNVRNAPGGTVIGTLTAPQRVTLTGSADGWLRIAHNGQDGFISGKHVKSEAVAANDSPGKAQSRPAASAQGSVDAAAKAVLQENRAEFQGALAALQVAVSDAWDVAERHLLEQALEQTDRVEMLRGLRNAALAELEPGLAWTFETLLSKIEARVKGEPGGGAVAPPVASKGDADPAAGADAGRTRAEAAKKVVAELKANGLKYGTERDEFSSASGKVDCSEAVQLFLEAAGQGDLIGRQRSNTGSIRGIVHELGGTWRKNDPQPGDLMMWEKEASGHVAMITDVAEDGQRFWMAHMGNSGGAIYGVDMNELEARAAVLGNGTFLGWWTPPAPDPSRAQAPARPAEPKPEGPAREPQSSAPASLGRDERAKLAALLEKGARNASEITDELFFSRHPELRGKAVTKGSPQASEWLAVEREVRQALSVAAKPTTQPARPTPGVAARLLSAGRLEAFNRAVEELGESLQFWDVTERGLYEAAREALDKGELERAVTLFRNAAAVEGHPSREVFEDLLGNPPAAQPVAAASDPVRAVRPQVAYGSADLGPTESFELTPQRRSAARDAARAHIASLGDVPSIAFGKGSVRPAWVWDATNAAYWAAFPHVAGKGVETAAQKTAYWLLLGDEVAAVINELHPEGQDPSVGARTDEIEEGKRVGLTDAECQSPELAALMSYERLPADGIAEAHDLIEKEAESLRPALYRALQSKVYYANQRDNVARYEDKSGGTCNLTALAMAMQAAGIRNPDPALQYEEALLEVARKLGKEGQITSPDVWKAIVEHTGHQFASLGSGTRPKKWWLETVAPKLESGWGVMMSITGHLVRLEAVTPDGLRVDDPYGSSKLLEGTARKFDGRNNEVRDRKAKGYNAGENISYPWEAVEKHSMLSINGVKR